MPSFSRMALYVVHGKHFVVQRLLEVSCKWFNVIKDCKIEITVCCHSRFNALYTCCLAVCLFVYPVLYRDQIAVSVCVCVSNVLEPIL